MHQTLPGSSSSPRGLLFPRYCWSGVNHDLIRDNKTWRGFSSAGLKLLPGNMPVTIRNTFPISTHITHFSPQVTLALNWFGVRPIQHPGKTHLCQNQRIMKEVEGSEQSHEENINYSCVHGCTHTETTLLNKNTKPEDTGDKTMEIATSSEQNISTFSLKIPFALKMCGFHLNLHFPSEEKLPFPLFPG